MLKTKRVLFFDIDGTLLDERKRLPSSAKEALRRLQEAGHELVLASGRSPFMIARLAEELRIDSYVGFNGQYVVLRGERIYTNPFRTDDLRALSGFASRRGHPLVYLNEGQMRGSVNYHPYVDECIGSLRHEHPACDPRFYERTDVYQTMLFCREGEERPYEEAFPGLRFVRWHPRSVDVLPTGGSKANGIAQLIGRLDFDPEQAYAFGDNLNDVEMFRYVGHSVAMGNAPEAVKKLARYVTTAVDRDGIANGLRLVGLLN
ncbi:hydrolase Cof [Cohnella sp. CIP 111063]|jgi:Cof subfamily protein (haloacid dehalogenase superfamily)|uniref:Cof-type HAD-IIB family hydrolase n=1 Tax=unclassified Cohnella TaxID=2636738 RepID=UPI000B8BDE1F|nr:MULTISPECIES: Cof-type HAD-IIB family hydrolase [unclassified Cohnella]OXS58372.1 hydrolase Cof [Cohnella sp. CIP 111063]PRX71658.1 hypothetical protein B0G52_108152 [Cohnella sp. SGD-V74]